jgi:hypothetical protein
VAPEGLHASPPEAATGEAEDDAGDGASLQGSRPRPPRGGSERMRALPRTERRTRRHARSERTRERSSDVRSRRLTCQTKKSDFALGRRQAFGALWLAARPPAGFIGLWAATRNTVRTLDQSRRRCRRHRAAVAFRACRRDNAADLPSPQRQARKAARPGGWLFGRRQACPACGLFLLPTSQPSTVFAGRLWKAPPIEGAARVGHGKCS